MRFRVFAAGSALALAVITAATAEQLEVQVKEAQIRSSKSPLGRIVATAKLGDPVEAEKAAGDKGAAVWYSVSAHDGKPVKGFVTGASLTAVGKSKATGQTTGAGAGKAEYTAAVKGWEKTHLDAAAGGANYADVSWMEVNSHAGASELWGGRWLKFRSDGKLGEFGRWGAGQQ